MKQFKVLKLTDSLNTKKMKRHINACNWYIRESFKKHRERKLFFDNIGKEAHNSIIKNIYNKIRNI